MFSLIFPANKGAIISGDPVSNACALLILFVLAVGIAGAVAALSMFIGRREVEDACLAPYECGLEPVGTPRRRFSVKFFLIALLFVIFDVEIVFLFPWARVYREMMEEGMGMLLLVELAAFIAMIAVGLAYVWRTGALRWED